MWKKDEEQPAPSNAGTTPRTTGQKPASGDSGRATIGPSISIKGDVTGSEDLLIQGKVDGSVTLAQHAVGVGSEGRVNADILGRLITIEGRVEGDLTAEEQIILRGSAQVHGDIKAPRVVLEDGATFRGLVDMGANGSGGQTKATGSGRASGKPTNTSKGSETQAGEKIASDSNPPASQAATSPEKAKDASSGKSPAKS
ncbi:MAG: polymer-forming cytoskeletal protein [Gemmatimonadota bacterium]|nr:polymer-forming cytoskeletal protein [Gemmatimonadota bacterium]